MLASLPMPAAQTWTLHRGLSLDLTCFPRHLLPPSLPCAYPPPPNLTFGVSLPMHTCSLFPLPPCGPQCSKSCNSGTRRRQVICAIGPPSHCRSLQLWKPADVEPCNTQLCHLPPGKDRRGLTSFPTTKLAGTSCLCCVSHRGHSPPTSPFIEAFATHKVQLYATSLASPVLPLRGRILPP